MVYICHSCKREVTADGLKTLPGVKCPYCGGRILYKIPPCLEWKTECSGKEKVYQKLVAKQRADVLELINVVTSKEHKGIVLDTFNFKRGQPLKIAGRADKPEPWYSFEEALTNLKGVSQPKSDNPIQDEKAKKVKIGMSFHYKTFTTKATK